MFFRMVSEYLNWPRMRLPPFSPLTPIDPELHAIVRTTDVYIDRRTVSAFAQVRDALKVSLQKAGNCLCLLITVITGK